MSGQKLDQAGILPAIQHRVLACDEATLGTAEESSIGTELCRVTKAAGRDGLPGVFLKVFNGDAARDSAHITCQPRPGAGRERRPQCPSSKGRKQYYYETHLVTTFGDPRTRIRHHRLAGYGCWYRVQRSLTGLLLPVLQGRLRHDDGMGTQ